MQTQASTLQAPVACAGGGGGRHAGCMRGCGSCSAPGAGWGRRWAVHAQCASWGRPADRVGPVRACPAWGCVIRRGWLRQPLPALRPAVARALDAGLRPSRRVSVSHERGMPALTKMARRVAVTQTTRRTTVSPVAVAVSGSGVVGQAGRKDAVLLPAAAGAVVSNTAARGSECRRREQRGPSYACPPRAPMRRARLRVRLCV